MVKVRMNTADVAAEVKCLRRFIGMRCSNVYDLSPKVAPPFLFFVLSLSSIRFDSIFLLCRPTCLSWWTAVEFRNLGRARRFYCSWRVAWDCILLSTCVTRATHLLVSLSNWGSIFVRGGSRMCANLGTIGYSVLFPYTIHQLLFISQTKKSV